MGKKHKLESTQNRRIHDLYYYYGKKTERPFVYAFDYDYVVDPDTMSKRDFHNMFEWKGKWKKIMPFEDLCMERLEEFFKELVVEHINKLDNFERQETILKNKRKELSK